MAKVGLLFIFILCHGAVLSDKLRFNGEAYEDLLVAVSPEVPQTNSQELMDNIKAIITEGSSVLHKATKGMSYIKSVKILVPNEWSSVTTDFASWELFEDSDIRVELKNSLYGDMPHTTNMQECGQKGNPQQGQYVSLSLPYLDKMDGLEDLYGSKGKVFVYLWAQYRYGVFEEHGYPNDPKFPLLYYNKENSTKILPNACGNVPYEGGTYMDSRTIGDDCSYDSNTGLMNNYCMFVANKSQPDVTSSIMSLTYMKHGDLFCDESNHNNGAPNRHNLLCGKKSVWTVISESEDFYGKFPRKQPLSQSTTPTFRIMRQNFQKFILLLDVSGSMAGTKLNGMIEAAKYWIYDNEELHEGSYLGIFKFSSSTTRIEPLTKMVGEGPRQKLARSINNLEAKGGTEIGTGLLQSVHELNSRGPGGVILLITDGEEGNAGPSMVSNEVLAALSQQEAKVFTMALGDSASEKLEQLAMATGGKAFFIAPDGDGFDDAFHETTTVQPGSSLGKVQIAVDPHHLMIYGNKNMTIGGNFTVDKSIGRDLTMEMKVTWLTNQDIPSKNFVRGGLSFGDSHHSDIDWSTNYLGSMTVGMADVGTWNWFLTAWNNVAQTGATSVSIDVKFSSKRRSNDSVPIKIKCSLTPYEVNVEKKVTATATVTQGGEKVLYTTVRARLERPGSVVVDDDACDLNLKDDGAYSDKTANDGIYTNVYDLRTDCPWEDMNDDTRFNLICAVVGDDNSFIPGNEAQSKMAPSEGGVPICCGSYAPEPAQKNPTGAFSRRSAGGSIKISPNPNPAPHPPATVTDLTLEVELTSALKPLIHINFRSPGNNFLYGTAKQYIIKYSKEDIINEEDFNAAKSLTEDMVTSGSLTPLPPRTPTNIIASLEDINTKDTVYFALKTKNVEGIFSERSNVPFIFIPNGQPVPVPPRPTTSTGSIRLLIAEHERDVPDCECLDSCQRNIVSNCLYNDFTCSTTCHCSCESLEATPTPIKLHGGTPFSSFTIERRILQDISQKEPCPFCPCEQGQDHVECDDSFCIQTCSCMCDRASTLPQIRSIDQQQDPATIAIEFYEFEEDDDYTPETFCKNESLPYNKVDCINGKCILLNVCITNSISFIESGLELYWISEKYSISNSVYTTYTYVDESQELVMNFCPANCEKEEIGVCNTDNTICTKQVSCFCIL